MAVKKCACVPAQRRKRRAASKSGAVVRKGARRKSCRKNGRFAKCPSRKPARSRKRK